MAPLADVARLHDRADALDEASRQYADPARRQFVLVRGRSLAAVAGERLTKRQAIATMRHKYESLRATYLRIAGTTYNGWLRFGPQAEWDEVLAAVADDAVWDRLVERFVDQDRERPVPRRSCQWKDLDEAIPAGHVGSTSQGDPRCTPTGRPRSPTSGPTPPPSRPRKTRSRP